MKTATLPSDSTQISAHISSTTKNLVERYAEAHGVKKGYLVEDALLHHLQALRELPPDVIIPPKMMVAQESAVRILERVRNPRKPTSAMKALFKKKSR